MDKPLLALTLRPPAPSGPSAESTVSDNLRQLIQLRWIAVFGQLVAILAVHYGLGISLPLVPMLAVVASLALANFAAALWLAHLRVTNREIMLALLFDTAALSVQLYFSGGAANPFISLFLLQVVLGAILLPLHWVWGLVAASCLAYAALTVVSRPLAYPPRLLSESLDLYTLGAGLCFALMGALLTLFITRISRNLLARDAYLADLRRQAAEEDGIVRMGLFASSAAHELGTPLASLSVILNDWRRIPAIARDPVLAEERAVMEAEVLRCKTIVTEILDSAGEPRGEAMASVAAEDFFNELLAAWRPTHPRVATDFACESADGSAVVASPALRQAIWNLLDNAAEASPRHLAVQVRLDRSGLVVAVLDEGPGFAPEQLREVGRPHQSTKGAGHGMGLFLAASVARKLGGRLEAANRPGGGAEVRLILPLAAHARRTT